MTEQIESLRNREAELFKAELDLVVSAQRATGYQLRTVREQRGIVSIKLREVRREIIKLEKSAKRKSRVKTNSGDKK